ncbi:PREDICTED: uncharacterized protein LOC109154029 [Ipomoea nil]|uniref:uncharacterized protein LOC109154029 n=1 Tax=Ipomoea nil TaxID=35883 RepID=UPI00090114E0|nr:PREDICTED: uncharacterized protein LOC109154029 [Ipomoea nil]
MAQPVHEVRARLPPPPPIRSGDRPQVVGVSPPPYCRYHRTRNHSPKDCEGLKEEIEALIKHGWPLPFNWWRRPSSVGQQWVTEQSGAKTNDKGKQPIQEEDGDRNRQHKSVINMIVVGPEGGDSARARKARARQLYVGAIAFQEPDRKKICREPIVFTDDDLPRGPTPHWDALVIAIDIQGLVTRWVLVDMGSGVNVLYWEAFQKLGLAREQMRPVRTPLAGFTSDAVKAEGCVSLTVELGTWPQMRRLEMNFVAVALECVHNVILGRPGIEDLGALISIEQLCMMFRTPTGVGVVRCDQKTTRSCYLQAC